MAKKALRDDQILAMVQGRVRQAVGFVDSKLARERERATRYYDGEYPKPLHAGNSKYVSQDTYDAVESMKATLLETFSGNMKPVQFAPQDEKDVEMARIATEYCSFVVFRQNNGYSVFHDAIHDGLMARNGIVKIWWDRREEVVEESFKGLDYSALETLLMNPDVELGDDLEQDETGLISGSLTRKVDASQVRLEVIPPEEFGISPRARSIEQAELVYHRTSKTLSDLRAEGYPDSLVSQIKVNTGEQLDYEPEVQARFEQTDDGWARPVEYGEMQDARTRIMVYEVYTNLDMNGEGRTRLWKITYAENVILDKEPVNRKPFLAFVPLPRPHSFWGSSYVSKVIPTQNARTMLTRSIIDHAIITNNPRYQVVKGGLVNPKELMENRIGGIVNVSRPDAVAPLPQAGLNPFVFQTISLLDDDKEETTGISKLSQGLNKDAISKQNSADMVQQLVSISQQRQKIIARNFAENFLKPLFLEVYQLVLENETRQKVIEVAGNWIEVDPQAWHERKDCHVEFALGYGEQEKEAQKYLTADQILAADPRLAPLYGIQQRYNTLRRAMECYGIRDVSNYLLSPKQVPPPQPSPAEQLQLQTAQKQLELMERQQALAERKLQFEIEKFKAEQTHKDLKAMADHKLAEENFGLKVEQFQHKATMDAAELAIVQSKPDTKAVASV